MTDDFALDIVSWQSADFGPLTERASTAEIRLRVGHSVLTEVEDFRIGANRDSIIVSAYSLSMWLLYNFWRLQFEPEYVGETKSLDWSLSHELPSIAEGFIWPPVSISGDGERLFVRPIRRETGDARAIRNIRFLNASNDRVASRGSFIESVDAFIVKTLGRLDARAVRETELHELYSIVSNERGDEKLARARRREAFFGFDPEQLPDHVLKIFAVTAEEFGVSSTEEIIAALLQMALEAPLEKAVRSVERSLDFAPEIHIPDGFRKDISARDRLDGASEFSPAALGKLEAKSVRTKLNVPSAPLTNDALAEIFTFANDVFLDRPEGEVLLSVAARKRPLSLSVALAPKSHHGRRFEFARILADDLFFGDADRMRPVTSARTWRQQFQRAFAAEFLCPVDGILDVVGGERRSEYLIEEIAQIFDVSTEVVANQLQNESRRFSVRS